MDDGSPEEAYGRVTNPERYRGLHGTARELVADLEARFVVERVVDVADPELVPRRTTVSTVRLTPAGHGAPVLIALTQFPGLAVRFGRWHTEAFPSCGCDACDEHPAYVANEFAERVSVLVAGNFREELRLHRFRRSVLSHSFWGDGWRSSGSGMVDREAARRLGPPGRLEWGPWRPR